MEVCKSDMISCAIEWQPSEAAFDVWPPKAERASQGKRPYSDPAMPDSRGLRMMLSYTLIISLHGPCGDGLRAKAGLLLCGVGNETDFQKEKP